MYRVDLDVLSVDDVERLGPMKATIAAYMAATIAAPPPGSRIRADLDELEKLEAEVAKLEAVIAMRYSTGPPLAWILAGILAALLGIWVAGFLAGRL